MFKFENISNVKDAKRDFQRMVNTFDFSGNKPKWHKQC